MKQEKLTIATMLWIPRLISESLAALDLSMDWLRLRHQSLNVEKFKSMKNGIRFRNSSGPFLFVVDSEWPTFEVTNVFRVDGL